MCGRPINLPRFVTRATARHSIQAYKSGPLDIRESQIVVKDNGSFAPPRSTYQIVQEEFRSKKALASVVDEIVPKAAFDSLTPFQPRLPELWGVD